MSAAPRSAGLSAELRQHATHCTRCQAVWKADELLRAAAAPNIAVALPEELRRALREHRGTTRSSSPWRRALAVSTACAASLTVALLFFPRPDLQLAFSSRVLPALAAFATLMALCLGPFLFRGQSALGLAPSLRWLSVVLSFAAFHAVCALQVRGGAADAHTMAFPTPRDCLALGLLSSLCIFATTIFVSRHSALVAPRAAGALAGASAGFGSLLFLQLHCPSQMALHLHIVHALPLVLTVALGALAGRRWLAA